jgi:hypothetical protein
MEPTIMQYKLLKKLKISTQLTISFILLASAPISIPQLEAMNSDSTTILILEPYYQNFASKVEVDYLGDDHYTNYLEIKNKSYFGGSAGIHIITPPCIIELTSKIAKGLSGHFNYYQFSSSGDDYHSEKSSGGHLLHGEAKLKLCYLNFFQQRLALYPFIGIEAQSYHFGKMGEKEIKENLIAPKLGLEANLLISDQLALYSGISYSYKMSNLMARSTGGNIYLFDQAKGTNKIPRRQHGIGLSASLVNDIKNGWSWVTSCGFSWSKGKRHGPDRSGYDKAHPTFDPADGTFEGYPTKEYYQAPIRSRSRSLELATGLSFGF